MVLTRSTIINIVTFVQILLLFTGPISSANGKADLSSNFSDVSGGIAIDVKKLDDNDKFGCNETDYQSLNGNSGKLIITKTKSCGYLAQKDTSFLGIRTTNLKMFNGDYIKISSKSNKTVMLPAPFEDGYLLFGMTEPTIEFFFNASADGSVMEVEFIQNIGNVIINCDTKVELKMQLIQIDKGFAANFVKSTDDPVHLEIVGSDDTLGHQLLTLKSSMQNIRAGKNSSSILMKISPALSECSKVFEDAKEASYELLGPATQPAGAYTCVNIFKTLINNDSAHFDVDFANFIKLSNSDDELAIDDGSNALKLVMFDADNYAKKVVSFTGQDLAVIYKSPGQFMPTNVPFKLTVKSKAYGGLVTQDKPLVIPKTGTADYTLVPQAGNLATLELAKVSGIQLILSDDNGNSVVLGEKASLPPKIVSNQPGQKLKVSLVPKGTTGGTINFKSSPSDCGGLFYGASGSISVSGAKTCYWLLGAQSSLLTINYNDLNPGGCLELYSLSQKDPIYKMCAITRDAVLPKFTLDQAYLKMTSTSNKTQFQASLASPIVSFVDMPDVLQRNISSIGYPLSYRWSSQSETITFDATNKSMILSVKDLDIRTGEKLMIQNEEVPNKNLGSLFDYDISNKVTQVTLKRSATTSDFNAHRGYKLIASEYQKIVSADMSKNGSLLTPANLTSLLVKFQAAKGKRVSYNWTLTGSDKDYRTKVIDSRSVLGRQVYKEELFYGNTSSDTLLISIIANNKNVIPGLTIQYGQLGCNQTTDHVCDDASRCVPAEKLCKGKVYCSDGSDLKVLCSSGPVPVPSIIEKGVAGGTVFFLCLLMFTFGVLGAIYGPDFYKSLEGRIRSGQYSSFTSTE